MLSPRPTCVLVLALLVLAVVPASAAFTAYTGPTATALPTFLTAAGAPAPNSVNWSAFSSTGDVSIDTFAFSNMGGITVSADSGLYWFDGVSDGVLSKMSGTWGMSDATFNLSYAGVPRALVFNAFPSLVRVFAFEVAANTNASVTIKVKTATSSETTYSLSNLSGQQPATGFFGMIADESISYITISVPEVGSGQIAVGDILTREGGAPPPPTDPPPGGDVPEASTLVMIGSSLYLLSRIRRGGLTWLRDGVA